MPPHLLRIPGPAAFGDDLLRGQLRGDRQRFQQWNLDLNAVVDCRARQRTNLQPRRFRSI